MAGSQSDCCSASRRATSTARSVSTLSAWWECKRLLHEAVHSPAVGVPELVRDLLVGVALGGQLHGARLAPLGQGPAPLASTRRQRTALARDARAAGCDRRSSRRCHSLLVGQITNAVSTADRWTSVPVPVGTLGRMALRRCIPLIQGLGPRPGTRSTGARAGTARSPVSVRRRSGRLKRPVGYRRAPSRGGLCERRRRHVAEREWQGPRRRAPGRRRSTSPSSGRRAALQPPSQRVLRRLGTLRRLLSVSGRRVVAVGGLVDRPQFIQ